MMQNMIIYNEDTNRFDSTIRFNEKTESNVSGAEIFDNFDDCLKRVDYYNNLLINNAIQICKCKFCTKFFIRSISEHKCNVCHTCSDNMIR